MTVHKMFNEWNGRLHTLVFGKLVINVKQGELCRRNTFKEIPWTHCTVLPSKIIMSDGTYKTILGPPMPVVINRAPLAAKWPCCNDYVMNSNL